ncbi:GNAT family N-acetyltransferase [Streptomyces sp. NPDC096205]|uniref:GNAT family N-acetyltransferase n=1 Tax=Streptomyces sp. NPDC096205 TaxID=3366081 RepID=UPI0037FA4E74
MPPTDPSADSGHPAVTELTDLTDLTELTDLDERTERPEQVLGGDVEDTLDLRLPDDFLACLSGEAGGAGAAGIPEAAAGRGVGEPVADRADLLDGVGAWGPAVTPAGEFQLIPVRLERDLPLIVRWMNDPAVAAFWELSGPPQVAEEHLRGQLTGDGRSVPCLGLLNGSPMSYWEIYRADLDPLARHYPARPHDTGVHVLIGGVADRGRGLGSTLLRSVADLVLDSRPACARVVAEPDLRNTPSVSAFLTAGFRFAAEVDLPGKRAALMVRDRSLRHLL